MTQVENSGQICLGRVLGVQNRGIIIAFALVGALGLMASDGYAQEKQQEQRRKRTSSAPVVQENEASVLQLDAVIRATLEHHPSLQGEMQERVAADADLLSARGAFDPSIKGEGLSYATGGYSGNYGGAFVEQPLELYGSKVFGGYRIGDGTFPVYDNWYETNSAGEAQFGVEVPLVRDGPIDKRRTAIRKSEAGQKIADALIEQRRIELARAAATAFWNWTAARNKVKVYRRLLEVANERNRQISERVQRGDLPDFDRVDNQRAVLQRQAQLLSAERAAKSTEFSLSLFYRDANAQPIEIAKYTALERIPEPLFAPHLTVEEPVDEAISGRPEFKNIHAQRDQNQLELQLARNQILPRLDLKVFAAKDYGTGVEKREDAELKGGLKIEIPLRTRTQEGRIDFYEAKQRKLSFTEIFLKEKIRADVQDALNALDIAQRRVEVTAREVAASRELAQGELTRFNMGDSNLIFVNLREQNAADAEVREIDALQDYQKAFVAFEAILARIAGKKAP